MAKNRNKKNKAKNGSGPAAMYHSEGTPAAEAAHPMDMSWSSPSAAAAASSGTRFGLVPSRSRPLLPAPSLARRVPNSLLVLRPQPHHGVCFSLPNGGFVTSCCQARPRLLWFLSKLNQRSCRRMNPSLSASQATK